MKILKLIFLFILVVGVLGALGLGIIYLTQSYFAEKAQTQSQLKEAASLAKNLRQELEQGSLDKKDAAAENTLLRQDLFRYLEKQQEQSEKYLTLQLEIERLRQEKQETSRKLNEVSSALNSLQEDRQKLIELQETLKSYQQQPPQEQPLTPQPEAAFEPEVALQPAQTSLTYEQLLADPRRALEYYQAYLEAQGLSEISFSFSEWLRTIQYPQPVKQ